MNISKGHKEELFQLMRFAEERKLQIIKLQEWEDLINCTSSATYVEVENNVDLEEAPKDFIFIHDYVAANIPVSNKPVVFCKCNNCYENKLLCCSHNFETPYAYDKFGRLQLHPGYPIHECNDLCKCGIDCPNRVVQHGQKIKVAIFRTSNGRGWGLKAQEPIKKGQYVLDYLGEIMTSDAAEIRGEEINATGHTYLFDLNSGDCKYTVDASRAGNASHFINHSCDPNLHAYSVYINCQDPQLPRLSFFAKRKIKTGEELTFDYKMFLNNGSSISAEGKTLCKCNTRKCRKYLC